ncbi:GDP-L-fucose synthase [uncultured archaeon]|nr:GDP-L-fucose synthase [uncultured archaeon]
MKILVSGGAGFVGSHIVDKLILEGHDVIVIDNLSSGKREHLNKKAVLYERDITKSVEDIFEKERPEIVIHTAAQVMLRRSLEEPVFDAMTNIIGTINVLEACRKNEVKKIIYTSTGGARYGEPKYLPVDENHPLNPLAPYGISKHTAEHYIFAYEKLYGLNYLIFGFGNVYGPRDDPRFGRVIAVFARAILQGAKPKIFGDGEQTRDFVYVKDLADFIVGSIKKNPEHKLFNLANGEQVSVNKIFEELKKASGFLGEAEHIAAVKGEIRDICLDTTLAKNELGWTAKTPLSRGIRETFEYFKSALK